MSQAMAQDAEQARVYAPVGVHRPHAADLDDARMRVRRVDQMPGGEIEIDARRNVASLRRLRSIACERQNGGEIDRAVEIGAGDGDTVIGKDGVAPLLR